MKWFKHISDSLDDPFISELIYQFGGDGYLVFFGVLEIYAREFKPEPGWKLTVTDSFLRRKLLKSKVKRVKNVLKAIKNEGKWDIVFNGIQTIIFIPKFTQLLDDTTMRKLRSYHELNSPNPRTEEDEEKDQEEDEEKTAVVPINSCPYKKIISLYADILPELHKPPSLNVALKKTIKARWNEQNRIEWWKEYFELIAKSDFLMGENDRGWKATFAWLVGPKNMNKVLSGNYITNEAKEDKPWAI